ncbi:MAG: F0F1 ATP synthase subunit B [Candidatus Gottesmanbacteria bacterium]|nr:F0F1 ATP synthase subunit B [Candidatus Gottesmanbacteria bacterium]
MEQLGIEPNLLLAQIVNFLIIFFVLSKLLYKPILGMLEKRKKEIAAGLELTEKLRAEEEKMNARKEKLLEEARKEARNIVEGGKKEAEAEAHDIIEAAHTAAQGIIAKGKDDVVELRAGMEKDVRKAAVDIAQAMTKQLLSQVLSTADQHKLIQKHVKELEKVNS